MKFLEGRSSRSAFLAVFVGIIVGVFALAFIGGASLPDAAFGTLTIVYIVGSNLVSVTFGVRRLHDIDKSGWWILLLIVPLANLILVIMLLTRPGTQGDNRFGPASA